nr:MAG TPA: SH3 domain protein [Caudoviricetes sp.]
MEKKKLGIGQYTTTSTCYFEGRISPTKVNMSLTDEAKAAVLEFLTESLDFHTLVCDIAGNVRKEVKPEKEYKELKEECLHVCDRYKQLQEISNDLLRRWKDETGKRMNAQAALEDSHSHHNNVMNEIKDLLKEVDVPSVKSAIEALKSERAKGKLLAEQYELSKNENDKLEKLLREIEGRYDRIAKGYDNACKEAKTTESIRKSISANYDRLAEDYKYLNKCVQNQANTIERYTKENKRLTDEVEKLKGKLDRASKRYGELIKIISDRVIKSI